MQNYIITDLHIFSYVLYMHFIIMYKKIFPLQSREYRIVLFGFILIYTIAHFYKYLNTNLCNYRFTDFF